jgi:DNA-binding Xre family transcriptional regulator
MKIDRRKLDLALARSCKSLVDLRGEFSSATLTKLRNNSDYEVAPKTIGRLARALGVPPEELIVSEGAK